MIKFSDLKRVWRIVVSVIVCQHIGGAICLFIGFHHFWFKNFFIGGEFGTFPGFIVGFLWQLKSSGDRRKWIGTASFLCLLCVALTIMAFFSDYPRMKDEMRRLESLSQLQNQAFYQIDVFDLHSRKKIMSIADLKSIEAFTKGIADVVGHAPNHPSYSHSWYVALEGPTHQEFELHLNPDFPKSVIGYFVEKSGNSVLSYGSFESKGLRLWIDKYLNGVDANQILHGTQKNLRP
jgi:hypothetical protein